MTLCSTRTRTSRCCSWATRRTWRTSARCPTRSHNRHATSSSSSSPPPPPFPSPLGPGFCPARPRPGPGPALHRVRLVQLLCRVRSNARLVVRWPPQPQPQRPLVLFHNSSLLVQVVTLISQSTRPSESINTEKSSLVCTPSGLDTRSFIVRRRRALSCAACALLATPLQCRFSLTRANVHVHVPVLARTRICLSCPVPSLQMCSRAQLAAQSNVKYLEASAKSGLGVERIFQTITRDILLKNERRSVRCSLLPVTWRSSPSPSPSALLHSSSVICACALAGHAAPEQRAAARDCGRGTREAHKAQEDRLVRLGQMRHPLRPA